MKSSTALGSITDAVASLFCRRGARNSEFFSSSGVQYS